jgi:DNA-binding NtrC family response regulator
METLQQHAWPGNVRELENVVERAMIASDGHVLRLDTPLAFNGTTASSVEMRAGAELLHDVERAHINAMLERCGWRINGKGNAAERLGMHPNTLRFRLKKLGLSRPEC